MWSDVVVLWRNGKLCYFGVKRKSDYCKDNSLEWLKLGKCFANHGLEIITHKVSNHNTFLVWVQFTSCLTLIHVRNKLQQAISLQQNLPLCEPGYSLQLHWWGPSEPNKRTCGSSWTFSNSWLRPSAICIDWALRSPTKGPADLTLLAQKHWSQTWIYF